MSYLQMPNGSRAPMVHPCHDPRHRVLLGAGEDGQNFEAEMLRTRLALRDRHHGLELASASLIGRSGSSAFRLSTTPVSMSLTGSCFSSDSAPRPLYGAFFVKEFARAAHLFPSSVS